MPEYTKVATGHSNTAGLTRFLVDPWVSVIEPGLIRIAMSGKASEHGSKRCPLRWSPKIPDSVKQNALTRCGLTNATYALVTVRLPSNHNRSSFANWNATAFVSDEGQFERGGWTGFEITLIFMEAL